MKLESSLDLWPTHIRIYDSEVSDDLNDRIIGGFLNLTATSRNHPEIFNSNVSSRSRANLRDYLDEQTTKEITELFELALRTYIDELYTPEFYDNYELYMDWSSNLYTGNGVMSHTHNETMVTMTYYPLDNEDPVNTDIVRTSYFKFKTGEVAFMNPVGFRVDDRFFKNRLNAISVSPKKGMIAIFPGNVPHFTMPGQKCDRICLAAMVQTVNKKGRKMNVRREENGH